MNNCQYCNTEFYKDEGDIKPLILDKIQGFAHEFEECILSHEMPKAAKNALTDLVERMRSTFPNNAELYDEQNDLSDIQW
jgi:hypothetical protein